MERPRKVFRISSVILGVKKLDLGEDAIYNFIDSMIKK